MPRTDKADAVGYLERLCKNLGLMESDPFWSGKVKEALNVITEAGIRSNLYYTIAGLVESAIGAALHLDPNQTTGKIWDEARQTIMNQMG